MNGYNVANWLMENNLDWIVWLMTLSAIIACVIFSIKKRLKNKK